MKGKEKTNGRKYFSYTNDLSTVTIVGTVREGPKVGERPKVGPVVRSASGACEPNRQQRLQRAIADLDSRQLGNRVL